MHSILIVTLVVGILALLFAFYKAKSIEKVDAGTDSMIDKTYDYSIFSIFSVLYKIK